MRFSQLLGGALRRRSSDQQQRPENAPEEPSMPAQLKGLDVLGGDQKHVPDEKENYAVAWNDPSKFARESERVAMLQSFSVLRTPAEHRFDCITK